MTQEESYMMLQITRVTMLSNAKFNVLYERLDKDKLHEIATVLLKVRGSDDIYKT